MEISYHIRREIATGERREEYGDIASGTPFRVLP